MIRLTTNRKTDEVLTLLEEEYKPLSRAEILKVALAELYNKTKHKSIEILDEATSKNVEISKNELENGEYEEFDSLDNLMSDLDS